MQFDQEYDERPEDDTGLLPQELAECRGEDRAGREEERDGRGGGRGADLQGREVEECEARGGRDGCAGDFDPIAGREILGVSPREARDDYAGPREHLHPGRVTRIDAGLVGHFDEIVREDLRAVVAREEVGEVAVAVDEHPRRGRDDREAVGRLITRARRVKEERGGEEHAERGNEQRSAILIRWRWGHGETKKPGVSPGLSRHHALFLPGFFSPSLRSPRTTSAGDDVLALVLHVGQLEHDVDHDFFDDAAQAAGAGVALLRQPGDLAAAPPARTRPPRLPSRRASGTAGPARSSAR